MDKYEALWKNKKSELAHAIIKNENKEDIYSFAKKLAEMELDEIEYKKQQNKEYEPQDAQAAKLFEELKNVSEPVVRFIANNYHPHVNVVIGMDFIKVIEDQLGMPTKNYDGDAIVAQGASWPLKGYTGGA